MNDSVLSEIKAEFLNEEGWKKTSPLDHEKVRSWMHSHNLEVLGAVHSLLYDKGHLPRVSPPLSFEESREFRMRYYERCLREFSIDSADADTWQWADWGFSAAHHVVYWFYELWQDKALPREVLLDVKRWLAGLLKEGVQDGLLATAVSDHLLSHKKIAKFFADWHDDPELCAILQWAT